MKYFTYTFLFIALFGFHCEIKAQADVTLTTNATAASNLLQGSAGNILYIAKMDVATQPVTVNGVNIPISGTMNASDISVMYVYFNATAPTLTGATLLNGIVPGIAAPHTFTINFSQPMAIGSSGYFIVTGSVSNTAVDGHTIIINGATAPLVFGFTTAPNVTNNQSNIAGTSTIQAANVTLTTNATAASTLLQGSAGNILYIAKMDVATQPVTVNGVNIPISGTMNASDISVMYVYFNATAPTLTGATLLNGIVPGIAAPHTFTINFSQPMAIGSSGYFIVTGSVSNTAVDGHTIIINGATAPLVFGFTTAPNVTNNQSNIAGTSTIQAANVTLTTNATAASNLLQGSAGNILYIAKMNVATQPVTVNGVNIPISGTMNASDISVMYVYFNATAPTLTGATLLNGIVPGIAAPHTFTINFSQPMAIGSSGYFIVTGSVSNTAVDGHTIIINGATAPLVFGFTTAPNVTNNQSNIAGTSTIQAANVTLTTNATAASTLLQGSAGNILYIAKMDVATQPVTVNGVNIPISGTMNASDISVMYVYFNATAPTLTGATLLNGIVPGIAAPHTFTINFSQPMAIGSSGYFIVTGSVSNTAVDGHTIIINGATAPLVFGFTTAPNVTNNQSNIAGTSTIQAANVIVATNAVPAAVIKPGSSGNIIYIAKMNVSTQPVTVNGVNIPLTGTVNATDIAAMYVYFNATSPSLTGATLLNGIVPNFAAPHTYTINFSQALISGASGYFIFTVNVSSSATIGNTVKVNGATGPVVFGFTTGPNVTNNQTDLGGLQTLPISLTSFTAKLIENTAQLNWTTTSEVNNASFDIERSTDGINFTWIGNIKSNPGLSGYHNYGFIDRSPETGTNFYRLKQIDFDSHSKYSSVIKIALDINRISIGILYPNPVKNTLTYPIYSPVRGEMLVRLSDVSGKVFINQKIILAKGKNEEILNVSQLAGGQYKLTFMDPATNTIFSKAVMILR